MGHTRRQFGHLLLAGVPWLGPQRATHQTATGVTLALTARYPSSEGSGSLDSILTLAADLGFHQIELAHRHLETLLGAPAVPPETREAPGSGLEQGLLDLEEDILRESADLERTSKLERLREWRQRVSLGVIRDLRGRLARRDQRIISIRWDGLARMTDRELDYAGRLALAIGAGTLSTGFSLTSAARLGEAARRHDLRLGLRETPAITPDLMARALATNPAVSLIVDLGMWAADGLGSPLPFLRTHAQRLSQIVLTDWRARDRQVVAVGDGDAHVGAVLREMRNGRWTCPAIIEAPGGDTDARAWLVATRRFCEAALLSS